MTVGHEVGFVGEVVANRVCVVTVGHEAGYEVTVGHEVGFVGEDDNLRANDDSINVVSRPTITSSETMI